MNMFPTESVLAAEDMVGCGIDVLDVSMSDSVPDELGIDVTNGKALVLPTVSSEVRID